MSLHLLSFLLSQNIHILFHISPRLSIIFFINQAFFALDVTRHVSLNIYLFYSFCNTISSQTSHCLKEKSIFLTSNIKKKIQYKNTILIGI